MRALIQRVSGASVEVDSEQIASIHKGLLVFLGVCKGDDKASADWLVDKVCGLRIFPGTGANGSTVKPMNASLEEISGEILVVSQFTLAADVSRGRRPGFSSAASPDLAEGLYDYFCEITEQRMGKLQKGRFAADMQVQLVNDGPVTFMLESPSHPRS